MFLVFCITLFACKKEIIYPSEQYPIKKVDSVSEPNITVWGEFRIIDAKMYMINHETGERQVYNHFGPNKNYSSLRWGGSYFPIEDIVKDSTTYSFYKPFKIPGYGDFVLNGDTSKHYAVYYSGLNKSIVEDPIHSQQLIGGSARPYRGWTMSYKDSLIGIRIQEVEGSIDGYNCNYWTELTLKKIRTW